MPIGRTIAPRGILLLSAAFAALTAATPAAAQENVFILLGRIILGTGTAKVAIDTPQAVTVIEQSDLDREQPQTIGDLFANVPGVQAAGASARAAGQAFNIRGIGNTEQNASAERIIVTVDGSPKFFEQYRMGSFFGDLELFKRVEVLRGPASSTLYGSGAMGGVVNFTTKDASDFLSEGKTSALRFKAGYDSNGDALRTGIIYAYRVGDQAEFLGALNGAAGNAQDDGAGTELLGTSFDRWSGLAKGTLHFGNDNDQSISLSVSRSDTALDDTVVAQTGGAAVPQFGTADVRAIDDTIGLSYRHSFAANPLLDLTVSLSHSSTDVEKRDFEYGMLCAVGQNQVLCPADFGYATNTLKIENTADLSAGNWDSFVTAGIQFSSQDRSAMTSVGVPQFHPEGTSNKTGVYVQGEFTLNEKLTLIPGIRVDFGTLKPGAAALALGGVEQTETSVSPKLAAMYKINDNWGVFGSLARTERMPTLDELFSTEAETYSSRTRLYSAERLASLNLEEEKAQTFELGFTYRNENLLSEGDSLQVKATAFHNDISNLIATTPRPTSTTAGLTPIAYYMNVNNAEIWGAELEAAYDSEHWFSQLAYSNVRSKDVATGLTLTDTPAENVALTVGGKFPDQNLVIGWRASYFDAITTASATTSAPSYDTHDLFVTWSPDQGALAGMQVNFGVDNVFDKVYRNNLAQDNGTGRNIKISVAKTLEW